MNCREPVLAAIFYASPRVVAALKLWRLMDTQQVFDDDIRFVTEK